VSAGITAIDILSAGLLSSVVNLVLSDSIVLAPLTITLSIRIRSNAEFVALLWFYHLLGICSNGEFAETETR